MSRIYPSAILGLASLFLVFAVRVVSGQASAQNNATQQNPCALVGHTLTPPAGCPGGPALPTGPRVYYAFCYTGAVLPDGGGQRAFYYSDIFLVDTAPYIGLPRPSDGSSVLPWVNEYSNYVSQKYAHGGLAGADCENWNTPADAQKKKDNIIQGERTLGVGEVETGWKWTTNPPIQPPKPSTPATPSQPAAAASVTTNAAPAATSHPPASAPSVAATSPTSSPSAAHPAAVPAKPAAPPKPATPPAAAAPAEKPAHYAACWGEVPKTHIAYFSAAFTVEGNLQEPRAQYHAFLAKNYGGVGAFTCRPLASLAEAQQQIQTWKSDAQAKDKLVDTGWKNQ